MTGAYTTYWRGAKVEIMADADVADEMMTALNTISEVANNPAGDGLYGKYAVFDGHDPRDDVFVLDPSDDPAARAALRAYAANTNDETLAEDLLDWVGDEGREKVCLCGSTRFKDEYRAENRRLTMEGKIVLSVGLFGHADDIDFDDGEKEMLDELHKDKIDEADRVHVIDPGGYIGDSTMDEIRHANSQGMPVTYYSEIHEDG